MRIYLSATPRSPGNPQSRLCRAYLPRILGHVISTQGNEKPKPQLHMTILRGGVPTDVEVISLEKPDQLIVDPAGVDDMARRRYPAANRCIYCGATGELTREHIIPYGLNGTAVIPAASCRECATKTSFAERKVLRGPMRAVRVLKGFQSRSKYRDAARTQPVRVVRNGVEGTIELPLDKAPVVLFFPEFAPPGVWTGRRVSGIDLVGVSAVRFGPTAEDVGRELKATTVGLESGNYEPTAFARMIAKIGFAAACAESALGRIGEPCPVIPAILGESNDIGRWVGTMTGPYRKYQGLLHRVALHEDRERGFLIAEVQLFANSAAPCYGVVLGTLR